MIETEKLKLKKFEGNDPLDYRVLNENADKLDKTLLNTRVVISDIEPVGTNVLWFNDKKIYQIDSDTVELSLGDITDDTIITANIDNKDYAVMNAENITSTKDVYSFEIKKD